RPGPPIGPGRPLCASAGDCPLGDAVAAARPSEISSGFCFGPGFTRVPKCRSFHRDAWQTWYTKRRLRPPFLKNPAGKASFPPRNSTMSMHRNCEGLSRRDTLQLGLGMLGGGGLANLLRLQAEAGEAAASTRKPTSCILIWMDGGPSHFETFDPKPAAPLEIRGDFDTIDTKIPGVQFSQYMTRLAAISDKFAVVRSVCHNQANHGAGNHYMMTGAPPRMPVGCGAFVSFHPSLGSVAAYECGAPNGLPAYFSMPGVSRSGGPNFLGAKYAPFVVADDPNNSHFRVRDVALPQGLADGRFAGRRELRVQVDRMQRIADKAAGDPVNTVDDYYRQGYNLVTSPEAQRAFDIHSEPEKTREAYGRNGFGQ